MELGVRIPVVSGIRITAASFPVVLGDFGYDVTCQACRENSPIALGSKPPLLIWIARTGLGTKLALRIPKPRISDSTRKKFQNVVNGALGTCQTPGSLFRSDFEWIVGNHLVFATCKVIQDSPGFWIPRCGFQIPDTGIRIFCKWNLSPPLPPPSQINPLSLISPPLLFGGRKLISRPLPSPLLFFSNKW